MGSEVCHTLDMESRRWLNQSQPQTLVIACFLLYLNAAFQVLALLQFGGTTAVSLLVIGGGVGGGYGIANERRWGYILALVTAFMPFIIPLLYRENPFSTDLITLIFEVALVALLLHTQSRQYQKIWFK
jgi:hypothetical protein